MNQLQQLFTNIPFTLLQGEMSELPIALVFDSRKAHKDTLFCCMVGTQTDGHAYVQQAYAQGCRLFVTQQQIALPPDATIIQVESTNVALGELACAFYGHPSKELTLVGVTGTNGKTTTATLLHDLFSQLGFYCGLLSTVVNKIGTQAIAATHTTPDPVSLNALLRQMVNQGCQYCFMEVSSHAIDQGRIAGLQFAAAGFTNITHDHLDYHHTFAEYLRVKKAFFDGLPSTAVALVNTDDKNGLVMLQNTRAKRQTYALKTPADFKGKIIENSLGGLILQINGQEVHTRLVGAFNASNLLLVYGLAVGLEKAGLKCVALNEVDKWACQTLRKNRPNWKVLEGDIKDFDFTEYHNSVDVVTGGFPCQAFSYAGKKLGLADARGTLFYEFARVVKEVNPPLCIGENVRGLLSHENGKTLQGMIS
ncbi:MAG: DNA (cytosine-5-)-methyltransferase, partial [Flavobacteriia bacterium]|nr:DNA (cytosine-5-)-methyltransferase [Flavobacteriia bacterium]